MLKTGRLAVELAAVGILGCLVAAVLVVTGGAGPLDNWIYDAIIRQGQRTPVSDALIVEIDERSLAAIGPWPWPRAIDAALVERLQAMAPSAIVFDVLFLEPSPDPADDRRLAAAMAFGAPVHVPLAFTVPGTNGRSHDVREPVPAIAAVAHVGQSNLDVDADGVMRRVFLGVHAEQSWTHLAARAAGMKVAPRPPSPILRHGDRIGIGYAGPPGTFQSVSAVSVLRGELPAEFVKGRTIFIGATAPGLGDRYATPVGGDAGLMPGVEIQANIHETLRAGTAIRDATRLQVLLFAFAGVALLMALLPRSRTGSALFGAALLVLAMLAASVAAMQLGHLWIAPGAAIIAIIVVQPVWAWRRLVAVNAYVTQELLRLVGEDTLLAAAGPAVPATGNGIDRQLGALRLTIERVRAARQLTIAALRSLPDPTLLVGLDGTMLSVNSAIGGVFSHDGPVSAEEVAAVLGPASLGGAVPEVDLVGIDGRVRQRRETPWRGAGGQLLGTIVRFADITALRRAEASRDEVIQLLGHDIRAPQIALLALADRESLPAPAFRERIRRYARRTLSLADGFLQVARADAADYQMGPVAVNDLLVEAADQLWPQASARGIVILTHGTGEEHMALGDRAMLTRALINLLDNAVKFSPAGGSIDCDIGTTDDTIVCTIADRGTGISAAEQATLFQRFSTRGKVDDSPVHGVGLGLAFVRSVFVRHGGSASYADRPGGGACFTLRLPCLPGA